MNLGLSSLSCRLGCSGEMCYKIVIVQEVMFRVEKSEVNSQVPNEVWLTWSFIFLTSFLYSLLTIYKNSKM